MSNKKRTKQYRPRAINLHSVNDAIRLSQLVQQDAKNTLDINIRAALLAFTQGVATVQHYDVLASTVDLCGITSGQLFNGAYKDELLNAREAMLKARERYMSTNRLGFDGEGLGSLKTAINIHSEFMDNVTGAEVLKMMRVRHNHINSGNVESNS